ncbi:MAG TPA: class I SAM-dependent methyltransferase [Bacteroidia bacterium]|jgi:predicted TPR repeat methyltransferase
MDKYRITFETWNKVAEAYLEKFSGLDLYNDTYDIFYRLLNKKAAVLEVGCGPGIISKYISAKRPDLRIDACDVSPRMIELAKQEVPAARLFVMDARELHTLLQRSPSDKKKYNAIISGFCIPYLSKADTEKFFCDCAALLEKNGYFYLSLIEGDHQNSGLRTAGTGDAAFVHYYDEAFITAALKKTGFEVLHTFRKPYSQETHLVFIAKK